MRPILRRSALALLPAAFVGRTAVLAQSPLSFVTAGQGSVFLPYGQGIARILHAAGVGIEVKESKGSNENLDIVDATPSAIGCAFLGAALDALNGTGFAKGKRHQNVRALFPMYETAFMAAALRSRKLVAIKDLDGKRVGCGPAAGPAEDYFRALAAIAGIKPEIASGAPAALTKQLAAGEIDAFWQGASVPIPSLAAAANAVDCVVFGLSPEQVAGMTKRFAFMADAAYPAGTYRGQTDEIRTVAAWNAVVAHKDLPEATAYAITKAVMTAKDLPSASTKVANATKNRIVPYHPGAVRALAELGVKVT